MHFGTSNDLKHLYRTTTLRLLDEAGPPAVT
jgi:hypothetical protein